MGVPIAVVWIVAVLAAAKLPFDEAPLERLRPRGRLAEWVARSAPKYSPTIARLVAQVQARDVIVYVRTVPDCGRHAAQTQLLNASGPQRYLLVTLCERGSRQRLLELFGHELHHVLEIANRPDVRDAASLRSFYGAIGNLTGPQSFETRQARETEIRVKLELNRFPGWWLEASRSRP